MSDDNSLLLPGLGGSNEALPPKDSSPSDETKDEAIDMGVVEVEEDPNVVAYKEMIEAAHIALGEQKISDISLNHPYWGLMNAARQFKHEKGIF